MNQLVTSYLLIMQHIEHIISLNLLKVYYSFLFSQKYVEKSRELHYFSCVWFVNMGIKIKKVKCKQPHST
jgi:hypothetical protein